MKIYNKETEEAFEASLIIPETGEEVCKTKDLSNAYYAIPVKAIAITGKNGEYGFYCKTTSDEEKIKEVFAAAQFWLDCKQFIRQQLNNYDIVNRRSGLLGEKIISNLEEIFPEQPPTLEQVIEYLKDIEYQTTICKNGEIIFTSYEWLRENITGFDK